MRKWSPFLVTVLAGVGAALAIWWRVEYPSRPTLKAQGEQIIAAVEQYRERHGEYPPSLADAGVTPPSHRYGPWRYERDDNSFSLAVGEYGRDLFVLSFDSRDGKWYLDD